MEVSPGKEGQFQFQQGILPIIDIHGVNFFGAVQQVVKNIAPGTGDDHQFAGWVQVKKLPVDFGIFPAGVIHEAVVVNQVEKFLCGGFYQTSTPYQHFYYMDNLKAVPGATI